MRIVILGGCGAFGKEIVKEVIGSGNFVEVVIADYQEEKAKELAGKLRTKKVKVNADFADANDHQSLLKVLKGADVAINVIGPFYKYGVKVVKATIEAKVNYVDIDDDYSSTQEVLSLDREARDSGVTIITGLGGSPGFTNVIAKYGASKLSEVDEINIAFAIARESISPAVIPHIISYMFTGKVPTYRDGQVTLTPAFEDSEIVEFSPPIGACEVYTCGHPEPITLPHYIKGVKTVTLKGSYIPPRVTQILRNLLVDYGLTSTEPITVKNASITPLDFLKEFMQSETMAKVFRFREIQPLVVGVIRVRGKEAGKEVEYIYRYVDKTRITRTVIMPVIGAQMLARGDIKAKGVFAPEAFEPKPFIDALLGRGVVLEELKKERTELLW